MKISKKAVTNIKEFFIILLLSFAMAVAYYSFITPNRFAPGGIYGLGSMIQNKTVGVWGFENGIPWAIPVIIMSIPLIIASVIVLNKKSAYVIAMTALSINAFDILLEVVHFPQYFAGDDLVLKLFAAAIGGILAGISLSFALKRFGISDGTVAVAAIIKKKRMNLNIAWATFALDAIVVATSFFVYWKDYTNGVSADEGFGAKIVAASVPVVYSVVTMFFLSRFCDLLLKGFSTAYKFEVICSQPEEIAKKLMQKLSRGVTVIKAEGMYTHTQKSLLICLVQKKQITDFKKILKDFPDAFAYIMPANEVMGDFSGRTRGR